MTRQAFLNAVAVDMAIGGSSNTVLHLVAIAKEAGVELNLEDFENISKKIPKLCALSPGGEHRLDDMYRAGGLQVVIKEVAKNKDVVDLNVLTVTGKTMAENVKDTKTGSRSHPSFESPTIRAASPSCTATSAPRGSHQAKRLRRPVQVLGVPACDMEDSVRHPQLEIKGDFVVIATKAPRATRHAGNAHPHLRREAQAWA